MKELAKQTGRIVCAAIQSWSATLRLCVLLAAGTAAWIGYHVRVK